MRGGQLRIGGGAIYGCLLSCAVHAPLSLCSTAPSLLCDFVRWSNWPLRLPAVLNSSQGSSTDLTFSSAAIILVWCDGAEVARLVRERHQDGDEAVAIRLRLGHRVLPLGEDGGVAFTA